MVFKFGFDGGLDTEMRLEIEELLLSEGTMKEFGAQRSGYLKLSYTAILLCTRLPHAIHS